MTLEVDGGSVENLVDSVIAETFPDVIAETYPDW